MGSGRGRGTARGRLRGTRYLLAATAMVLLVGACSGPSRSVPTTTVSVGLVSGGPASPGAPATVGAVTTGSAAAAPGPRRPGEPFTSAVALSDAVVAAVRARGSVMVVTTAEGTSLVSHRAVRLVAGREDYACRVTFPGRDDESLVVVADTPYVSVRPDPQGRRWQRRTLDDLAGDRTWASAAYLVDLPTELGAWRLATGLSGGEPVPGAESGVRRYVVTLGPAGAAAQLRLDRVPAAQRPAVEERLDAMTFDLTVTLGPDDLPRTITTVAPASGLVTTQQYTEWGGVTVAAPDPDDVRPPGDGAGR